MKARIVGAVVKVLKCPEHGRYSGGVLYVGESAFPSRCPECRADDERLELLRLKERAFAALTDLGRVGMGKRRKRREGDREFFVRLHDEGSNARIAVGNFWAASETEAISMAEREYPGLFSNLSTHTWKPHVEMLPFKTEVPA